MREEKSGNKITGDAVNIKAFSKNYFIFKKKFVLKYCSMFNG